MLVPRFRKNTIKIRLLFYLQVKKIGEKQTTRTGTCSLSGFSVTLFFFTNGAPVLPVEYDDMFNSLMN